MTGLAAFNNHQRLMFASAYRMLGSLSMLPSAIHGIVVTSQYFAV
jgi:hypothetical protein